MVQHPIISIGVIVAVGSIAILLVFIARRKRRIASLLRVMAAAGKLDFSPRAILSKHNDDIDDIARGINKLIEELDASVNKINEDEQKYRSIVEDVTDAVYTSDKDGRFLYINPSCERLTGFPKEELLRKHFYDLVLPGLWKKKVITFYTRQARNKIQETIFSFPILTYNGTTKWVEQTVRQLYKGEEITGYHCVVRDVSQRKQAEVMASEATERLWRSNIFIDSVLENIPNMIFVKDAAELRFVRLNKAGEELLGYSRMDLIGKNDYDFFPKEQADFFTSKDRAVLESSEALHIAEEPIDTKFKGKRWLRTKKIAIRDEKGKPLYLLGISEDITESKDAADKIVQLNSELKTNLDQLSELNQELESFTSSVSHDLRAPVRAIIGFSGILKKNNYDKLDEDGKSLLDTIKSESIRMGMLIDDLLSFARLGKKEIQKTNVDMTALAREAVEEVLKLAEDKFSAEIEVKDMPPAYTDASLMKQVWINLISNALKFSGKLTSPRVEIGVTNTESGQAYYVRDNGVGFDMKFYGKLFGVFQRLHSMEDFKGTGMGLAIVKRIIDKHGGRVWAEGQENQGASFYFTVPGKTQKNTNT